MTLETRVRDALVAVATDFKLLRVFISGSATGTLSGLNTTDKTSLVAAINEVKSTVNSGPSSPATETTEGTVRYATLAEVTAGAATNRAVTPAGVRQERIAIKNEILGGVGPMADTLQEIYSLVQAAEETSTIDALTTVVGTKVNSSDIGNTDADFVAAYNAAKA